MITEIKRVKLGKGGVIIRLIFDKICKNLMLFLQIIYNFG